MSTTSAPYGFRPAFHNSGQMRPKAYTIASTYAASIYSGDPVKLVTAGTIQLGTSDGTRTGTTDGISLLGIFAGVEYYDSTGKPTIAPFWTGGTTGTQIVAWVYDDPETIYDVQFANPGTAGTDSVQTAVGAECDWRPTAGGSTATGISSTYLAAESATSGQFQITGYAYLVTDSPTDAFVNMSVRLNESQYKAPVNTVS
jgi:hypothetical protein